MDELEQLKGLGYELPDLDSALKMAQTHYNAFQYGISLNVIPYRQVGRLVFSACIPTLSTRNYYLGTLGKNLSAEEGYQAARIAATAGLLGLRYAVKDLGRVEQILRVFAHIVCVPEFRELTRVARGAWDVFTEVLGKRGEHVSVPVGMTGLAGGHCIELILITEVKV